MGQLRGVEDSSDSDSDLMPQPRYIYVEEGVAGPLGQLRGVEDSSDSDSDLMPQPRYIYVEEGVAGSLGQLTAVDDSSDSGPTFCYTPDMVPTDTYEGLAGTAEWHGGQLLNISEMERNRKNRRK